MPLTRKAINYDLDDNLLKKYYPNPRSYKNAWRDVKSFLCKHGFEDRQYSGVISSKPMTAQTADKVIKLLNNEFGWLAPCVMKMDITSIGKVYDELYVFSDAVETVKDNVLLKDSKMKKDYNPLNVIDAARQSIDSETEEFATIVIDHDRGMEK